MKPINGIAAAVASCVLLAGAALAAAPEESILIVEGAQTVQNFLLSPSTKQVNYEISLPYPAQAVGDPQWQQLQAAGWHRCHFADPAQETANQDWSKSIDGSVTPNRIVHQRQTYWAKDEQMIAVKLRYYSEADGPTPDTKTQRVHLVFYSERGQAMASYLQVDCGQ